MGVLICEIIMGILVIIAGTCIFSFLNVIIYRVPRQMSFVKYFSICPSCGERLEPKDLVPVFSYLFLNGKCRYCKASIGIRDTLIEVLGGLLALLCVYKYENYGTALTVFAFFCILTVVAFLDIETMEIEDGCPDRDGDTCGHIHIHHARDFAFSPSGRRAVCKPSDACAGDRDSRGFWRWRY